MARRSTAPAKLRKDGRHISRTPEERRDIVERICAAMSEGETVTVVAQREGVSRRTLWEWTEGPTGDVELADLYSRARVCQAHALAEGALVLADAANAKERGSVDKARLQVDTRKWFVSKIAPRLYGEKIQQEITGAGGAPLIPPVTPPDLSKLSLEQLEQFHRLTVLVTVAASPDPASAAAPQLPAGGTDGR